MDPDMHCNSKEGEMGTVYRVSLGTVPFERDRKHKGVRGRSLEIVNGS